jgi:hypothetical protein
MSLAFYFGEWKFMTEAYREQDSKYRIWKPTVKKLIIVIA